MSKVKAAKSEWPSKALRYGLIGGGVGAAGSLILNALHSIRNRRRPVEQLVPRTIVEQPYYVDDDEAQRLKERGVEVNMPEFGKLAALRTTLYDRGECFTDIVEKTHVKIAEGGVGQWLGEGVTDIAVPALAGLGGGYLGFRGVDWLFDKMHKDSAKDRYDKKRQELRRMMDQMNAGLGKVAYDRLHGGNLGDQMAFFVNNIEEISKIAGEILHAKGVTKTALFQEQGNKLLESIKPMAKGYGGWMIGLPLALAAASAFPAALRAFKQRNPNTQTVREIEDYYRELPDQPRIKLVPTLRRRPKQQEQEEDAREPIAGPGYKAAAASNPSLAGGPVHSSIEPPRIDTSPDEPQADLADRPGVPMSLGQPATAGPASNTAMPHPNSQTSTSPTLAGPGQAPSAVKPFSGMFANTGFTRRNVGNMPAPKNPQARTPQTMAGIGNALG